MLKTITKDIWTLSAPLLPFNTHATMTIVRLESGDLVIISPIKVNDDTLARIKELGRVSLVISPNSFHHLYFHEFLHHFPDAEYVYSPSLKQKVKRRIKQFHHVSPIPKNLGPWTKELQPILIDGMPFIQEYVFYHIKSKTLICCDFLFLIHPPKSLPAKLFWRLVGNRDERPCQSRFFRFFIKDKEAYRRSVDRLLKLPIERIVVAHERVIEGELVNAAKDLLAAR